MQQPSYDTERQQPSYDTESQSQILPQENYPPPPRLYDGGAPTIQSYLTAPPPPSRKPNAWQRYRSARKRIKIGVGCSVLFLVLLLCSCPVAAIGAANLQKNVTNIPTTTKTHAHVAQVTTTRSTRPTEKPTPVSALGQVDTSDAIYTPEPNRPTTVPTQVATIVPTPVPTETPIPTDTPTPTVTPTQPPAPIGVNRNPWGYDFNPGNLIYSPNGAFCSYFSCLSTFWTANNGYVVECSDGEYSHRGGVRGACSRNGKVAAILYSH